MGGLLATGRASNEQASKQTSERACVHQVAGLIGRCEPWWLGVAAAWAGAMTTKEEQRREHNEQKEQESLRRVFDQLDKNKDGKVDFKDLNDQLIKLDYRAKRVEVEDMIWEVDEDCDHAVSWEEFRLAFYRCRTDKTGLEPRKLFNVVEFMMHDKDSSGTIDMDECMEILFRRFGKDQLEERTNDFFKHDTDGDNAISFAEFQRCGTCQARPSHPSHAACGHSLSTCALALSLAGRCAPFDHGGAIRRAARPAAPRRASRHSHRARAADRGTSSQQQTRMDRT